VVVTGDPVSMLSEALVATSPPRAAREPRRGRAGAPARRAAGRVPRRPLDEAARVAAEIRARGLLPG
jgi:mitochondrial fission protein ELM1